MRPRITLSLTTEGELEIYLNPAGRDLLVKELQGLREEADHFHFGPVGPEGDEDRNADVGVSPIPYGKHDQVITWGKVLFRPDAWDAQYYPHVMARPIEEPRAD